MAGAEAVEPDSQTLRLQFESPPNAAKPYVWWHWVGGDITEEGISADLQWMRAVGIGGVENFSVLLDNPSRNIRPFTPVIPWTPEWNRAVRHAISLADQSGLEFGIASGPGFGESGGPWVAPEEAMKKLVWSELKVQGNVLFTGVVPRPPANPGAFQNAPWENPLPHGFPSAIPTPDFYRDIAVVAFPVSSEDRDVRDLHPHASSSAGPIPGEALWDDDFNTIVHLPFNAGGQPSWIEVTFDREETVYSTSLSLRGTDTYANTNPELSYDDASLEYSHDGVKFSPLIRITHTTDIQQTLTFSPVRARYFRLLLPPPPVTNAPAVLTQFVGPAQTEHQIAEWWLYTTPRINHFESKAGYFIAGATEPAEVRLAQEYATPSRGVIDLTTRMRPDGTLTWKVPPGHWIIQRFGFSLLGAINFPATADQTGLETDKLSAAATRHYVNDYLDRYQAAAGPGLVGTHGLRAILNDSWELGGQNWTDDLPQQFSQRRGYALTRWLPTLTGRIIDTMSASERFLWDFRRTLGELVVEGYYGEISRIARQRGLIHYGEAHEAGRALIADGMDVKGADDIPTGAMWAGNDFVSPEVGDADLVESASVAHTQGTTLVAAESMTMVGNPGHAFASSPESLKLVADREFADGVNRIFIHTSVHQPSGGAGPGMTLGPYGQWLTRNETWADQAAPFMTYLARNSYLLQQGHAVTDVLYFYGQNSNVTDLYAGHLPSIPPGYSFDFASANTVEGLSVSHGELISKGGAHYRVLAIDPRVTSMSLDVLKRLSELVAAGAVVVGDKPSQTPSLADDEKVFEQLTHAMWSRADHHYGQGLVIPGHDLTVVLSDTLRVQPDFVCSESKPQLPLRFAHRRMDSGQEIYFLSNPGDHTEKLSAHFRVSGLEPEIWHPDSGLMERHVSYTSDGAGTLVALEIGKHEALFVVFLNPTSVTARSEPELSKATIGEVKGPWSIHFPGSRGAAAQTTVAELKSWSQFADPAIKYFSGTARYTASLSASQSWFAGAGRLLLDLGAVKNVATVWVNGRYVGIGWKTPYRLDVTDFLRAGQNTLTVDVTNSWVNRLIGDRQPGGRPMAETSFNPYSADSPLLDSGLTSPVTFIRVFVAPGQ